MWSIKSIINKILGRTETEEPKTATPSISPQKTKEVIKPKEQAKVLETKIAPEKLKEVSKEKIQEPKTIKAPKEIKEVKKRTIKPQEKLPSQSSFDIKEADIEIIKPVKTQEIKPKAKSNFPQSKDNLSWKEQANAAEKIKRAFQGFFYDVASLESINNLDLKKNNFEGCKITFKTKLEQNLSKLDLLDQQILQHISNSLLSKDIKDITETLEKQTMEQVSKVPDKYIN